MKKLLYLFFAITLLACGGDDDRELIEGNIVVFNTQEQIDNFNYFSIDRLTINGSGITNIDNLSTLEKIGQSLTISNTGLTNLNGLQSVMSDANQILEIAIIDNPVLVNINSLGNLAVNAKTVELTDNPSLITMNEFIMSPFGRSLTINNIPAEDYSNFLNLTGVSFGITLANLAPSSVLGFANCSRGNISLENINIQDMSAFSSLSNGEIIIFIDMNQLISLNGLENNLDLNHIKIRGTNGLVEINAISEINDLIRFTIEESSIENLSFLSNELSIGFLTIEDSPNISSLFGLESLINLRGIAVLRCVSFNSLEGTNLSELNDPSGTSIYFIDNPLLSDYCPIQPYLEVGGINFVPINGNLYYEVSGNAYNPLPDEIVTEDGCSQ